MKKYLIILLLVIVAIAIGAYFFLFGKKDVCKNVVPEDAKAVLVIDAKQALKQLDFSISDIFKALKHRQQQKEDDKAGWGIDMLVPMYGFVSADNYVCGVFALSDADDFEEKLREEEIAVESQRGFKWADKDEILLCFDSKKALAIGPVIGSQADAMRGKMVEWMNQGSHKVPVLSALKKDDGVVSLRSSLAVVPPTITNQMVGSIKDVNLNNIFLNASLRVKEKSFLLSTELESEDEKFDDYASEYNKLLRPIDGKKLPACMEEPMLRAVFNVEGEKVLPKLRENFIFRTMLVGLNLCVDLDMMIKAIDGDVLFEVSGGSIFSPNLVASAQIKNQDFLKNAKDWCSGSSAFGYSCQALGDKDFVLLNARDKFFFGVHDDFLYLSTDNIKTRSFSAPQLEENISQVREQAQGKRIYASVDFARMLNSVSAIGAKTQFEKGVTSLERINVSVTDFRHIEYELTTKEKTTDFIKGLLK
jgi:hypothetical protein